MRIAFYAPLKPPGHPVPSGDREMARLLMAALRLAGHDVVLTSDLRTYSPTPDPHCLADLQARAAVEIDALSARRSVDRPDVWLTYHPYYKAPDLIGPAVARALGIPYATAEASHAGKRDLDAWHAWQRSVADALCQGAVHFCLTPVDRQGLARLLGGSETLVDLPPFVDSAPFAATEPRCSDGRLELVTVAMMRPGKKVRSYRFLADALRCLGDIDWRLTIVGDGDARDTVAEAFALLPERRLRRRGEVARDRLAAAFAAADLFVWPGFEEDYGMVYLEAQAAGLPVVALASDGVRQAVRDGETGLLVEGERATAFAEAIRRMASDHRTWQRMACAARAFAYGERSLANAAAILDRGLRDACEREARSASAVFPANFRRETGLA